jgi:dienelactone hydrolase
MNPIAKFLKLSEERTSPEFERIEVVNFDGYIRSLIQYQGSEGDRILAYLFEPTLLTQISSPAVLIHHQHNGEQFLGKSEVAGIKGNPLQAFGPALAQKGFVVLAPDQICFEDRRRNKQGTDPAEGEEDFLQQFNEMSYRLVKGDTLIRKILDDATLGFSILFNHKDIDQKRIGIMGHSLGGNTSLFHAAIDERVQFACSSGALCSYKNKMEQKTSFEMGLIIPGFLENFEMRDLVQAILPRDLMIVSADQDKYSKDADVILNDFDTVKHFRFQGGHALDERRHSIIIDWVGSH